jgi:hypothetical protein
MWVNILLKALIFMLFVPGVHMSIPPHGTLVEKALIHGVFFAVANYIAYKVIRPILEGFKNPDTRVDQPCPEGSVKCPSGDCRLKGDLYSPCS